MTNEPCTVRAEHGDCGAHPPSEPWTDEDVRAAVLAIWEVAQARPPLTHKMARSVLAALAPRLVGRERAAATKALRQHCVWLEDRALAEFNANHESQGEAYRTAAGWAADAAERGER